MPAEVVAGGEEEGAETPFAEAEACSHVALHLIHGSLSLRAPICPMGITLAGTAQGR